jgi:hypothetical protein
VNHRRNLNADQQLVLELLYKFRFGSNDLIAQYFGKKDRSLVFKRLAILQELGLVGKRFDSSYRLRGRPAAYYLLPEGARTISKYRDEDDTDEINVKTIYKDAIVSERFVDHCLAVFALYMQLMDEYDDDLNFFSKADQANFDNFPKKLPDAYLTLGAEEETKHFFLDILDDDAHLLIDASKKIKRYVEYKRSGDWVLVVPKIIFVCNTEEAAAKVQKRCNAILHKMWLLDVEFEAFAKEAISLD